MWNSITFSPLLCPSPLLMSCRTLGYSLNIIFDINYSLSVCFPLGGSVTAAQSLSCQEKAGLDSVCL